MPDESTILRFRYRLEKNKLAQAIQEEVNELLSQRGLMLKAGTVVDATLKLNVNFISPIRPDT